MEFDFENCVGTLMNTNKLAINWQNYARDRIHLKFAFIIRL